MSAYRKLIQQYKQQLRLAVTTYETSFSANGKSLSADRAQDILQLESIWSDCDDGIKLREGTIQICNNINKGWFSWFSWLRRSQLKSKIMKVVNHPNYSDYSFCLCLKLDNEFLSSLHSEPSHYNIQLENKMLKQTNQELIEENLSLKAFITNIQKANSKLAAQVQSLHQRLLKLEQQQSDDDDLSPSSEVMKSFREFSITK